MTEAAQLDEAAQIAAAQGVLSDWTDLRIEHHSRFWLIAGNYQAVRHATHSQRRDDPHDVVALARDFDAAIKAASKPNPVPVAQHTVTTEPATMDPAPAPEDEPIPDGLARLLPPNLSLAQQKATASKRYMELHHRLVDAGRALVPLTVAERAELEQLERWRGWFN